MVTARDPITVADVVLDAALAADADAVIIEPAVQAARYTIAVARHGEILAVSAIETQLAIHTIARLGYVCQVDPAATRPTTGRARIRSCDTQRDLVVTIAPGDQPRAELMFVSCGAKQVRSEPVAGDRIGHYQVVRQLGAGGMGDVYEVEHVTLHRRAALKILQETVIARDAESLDRFRREAQATARIRSRYIVEVFDFGYLDDGRPYFVMELLGGTSLCDMLEDGPLPIERALELARQIAIGLVAAHQHGVIHADVTPSNILLEDDHVKVIDFGLARLRDQAMPDGLADQITGTPSYVSPEQLTGHAASEASDQYSLGCVPFEMLAGHPPFEGSTTTEICFGHVRSPAPRATSPYARVPAALAQVVARCLAKHPKGRYASMQELADALEAVGVVP